MIESILKLRRIKRGEGGDPALIKNRVFWHAESQGIFLFYPIKLMVFDWLSKLPLEDYIIFFVKYPKKAM
jgi:hypothetical protein